MQVTGVVVDPPQLAAVWHGPTKPLLQTPLLQVTGVVGVVPVLSVPVVCPVVCPAGNPGNVNVLFTKSGLIVLRINQAEKRTKVP